MKKQIYNFTVKRIDGTDINLKSFEGKVLLVVNVASKCGLTPQYEALEKIYNQYRSQGLEVLGFPANEFGEQEPGSNVEIQEFCRMNYNVNFNMFQKIIVKGDGIHPLYDFLINEMPEAISPHGSVFEDKLKNYGIVRSSSNDILWNFEKFLINRHGEIVARFNPDVEPTNSVITDAITSVL